MRVLVLLMASVAIALGLGGWSARRALDGASSLGNVVVNGYWRADTLAGSVDANPYEKARLSRIGDLTLGTGEGIQFRTFTDMQGAGLRRECSYRLRGALPLARVWTLSAFTPAGLLIRSGDGRPGWLVSRRLMRAEDNSVEIVAGPQAHPGNWLSVTGEGPFALVLTLYDTPASTSSGVAAVEMLDVEPIGCTGA